MPRRPDPLRVEDAIRIALFFAFTALFARVALRQVHRMLRVHRRYSDPGMVARLLAEDRADDERPRSPGRQRAG